MPLRAQTTERIVTDRHTGVAIGGFDPVAYFTQSAALIGSPDHEYTVAGVTWRFRNEGNLGAFVADPQVYTPAFGGYDPVIVARGVASPGHPQIFLIHDKRIYLFSTEQTRKTFANAPQSLLGAARAKWPEVLRTLVP